MLANARSQARRGGDPARDDSVGMLFAVVNALLMCQPSQEALYLDAPDNWARALADSGAVILGTVRIYTLVMAQCGRD